MNSSGSRTPRRTAGPLTDKEVDFKYDVFGNRIEKDYDDDGAGQHSATITRFAYDGWKNTNQHLVGNENWDVWADLDGGSSLTTRYIRGDAIDQIFARIDSGTTYWELTERLGSVRDVIDNNAVVKDTIGYDVFGNITSETNSTFRGRYSWTGRETDAEINLQYNRARYYDAGTGLWITQDPFGFGAGDSNLYRYANNYPNLATDPSGLQLLWPRNGDLDDPRGPWLGKHNDQPWYGRFPAIGKEFPAQLDNYPFVRVDKAKDTMLRADVLAAAEKVRKARMALEMLKRRIEDDRYLKDRDGNIIRASIDNPTTNRKKGDPIPNSTPDFILQNYRFYLGKISMLDAKLARTGTVIRIRYLKEPTAAEKAVMPQQGKDIPAYTPVMSRLFGLITYLGDVTVVDSYFKFEPADRAALIIHEWGRFFADLPGEADNSGTPQDVYKWDPAIRYLAELYDKQKKEFVGPLPLVGMP